MSYLNVIVRRSILALALFILALLLPACSFIPPILDLPIPQGATGNLVIIGWDGYDRAFLDAQLAAGELPELQRLIEGGTYWPLLIRQRHTDTKPGWAAVMTGVNPESMGIFSNPKSQPIPDGLTLFERLRMDDPEWF